jgi:hypothetical protein
MDSSVVCRHTKQQQQQKKKIQTPSKKGATSTKTRLKDVEAASEIFIGLFHINLTLQKLL